MEDKLKRLDGETKLDYIRRLTYGKLVDKTIDLDYTELAPLIFNQELSSCECRKRLYGVKSVLELLDQEGINNTDDSEIIKEIELKIRELKKERYKLQTEKIEYNKMIREQAREELLIEKIKDVIPTLQAPTFKPLQVNDGNKEYLLCFSDIHYDKFFESVNNKYSIDEVHRRFNLLLSKIIKLIKKENITKLNIVNCGDSLEGLLRISAIKTMRVGLLESVIQFSRFMAEWLNKLSEYVEIKYIHVPTANHSELRMFNQKRGETDENLERIIVNYIHDLLKNNSRIEVPITTGNNYVNFNLLGYNFIALHGDSIKNIKNSLKDLSVLHRRFYDYVIMGHFHSGVEHTIAEGYDNNMEVLVVPSIVGSDTYSDSLFVGSKSSAKLYTFEQNQGHTETYNLILN